MYYDFIRVSQAPNQWWTVTEGRSREIMHEFHNKSSAVAYARAMSWSRHATLYVDDEAGAPVRQSRASLTYPVSLE